MTPTAAAARRFVFVKSLTERLTEGVQTALAAAGLPSTSDCVWEVPRQSEHGDYATNAAMVLARAAKRPPRQIAEPIVKHFPPRPEVARLEVAGPGFLNVFLAPAWCAGALREILRRAPRTGAAMTRPGSASASSSCRPIRPGRWSSSTRARRRSAIRWRACCGRAARR